MTSWRRCIFTVLIAVSGAPLGAAAQDAIEDAPFEVESSERETFGPRLIGNVRLRYEGVNDDAAPLNGNALTIRYRGTLEFHLLKKTTILTEVEAVGALLDNYNDGSGSNRDRPVLLDPEGIELNRAQLLTEIIPDTRITIGRQRITLDDQRFVGGLAFRQNDQTFDAVRATRTFFNTIDLDATYLRRVNRILGGDNPNGVFKGDSYLVNVNAPTPFGRVSAFHYALDLETGPDEARVNGASSRTTGVRLLGRRHWEDFGLVWEASYARQTDFADNPADFSANYWLGSVAAIVGDATVTLRSEILGSDDGVAGFQTPIGTLHRFQGDADLFLVTPASGVVDLSAALEWRFGGLGPLSDIKGLVRYHDFSGAFAGEQLGTELDATLSAKLNRTTLSFGWADYNAQTFSTDTRRVFITIIHPF